MANVKGSRLLVDVALHLGHLSQLLGNLTRPVCLLYGRGLSGSGLPEFGQSSLELLDDGQQLIDSSPKLDVELILLLVILLLGLFDDSAFMIHSLLQFMLLSIAGLLIHLILSLEVPQLATGFFKFKLQALLELLTT